MRGFRFLALFCLALPLGAATDRPLQSFPGAPLKDAPAGADVLFVVSGDNRPTAQGAPLPPVLKTIFAEIGLIRPDFVIWTGGTADAAKPIAGTVPLFHVPGRRESPLYGSFDYAGVHFIALGGEPLAWLKDDLESNKEARAIVVFTPDRAAAGRRELQDLFARYPVTAVFSGREPPLPPGYLVVRLVGDKLSFDIIEPGHLSLETAPAGQNEAKLWIVNSNATAQPLPVRGIEVESPLNPQRCEGLKATAATRNGDIWTPLDGVAIDGCAVKDGTVRLHVKVPPLPQGSVLVTVRRNGTDGRPVS